MKPYLRDFIPGCLDDIPDNTTYEAGYLVSKNSGWRSKTPVIDNDKCVGCLECYLYCPDGCIYRTTFPQTQQISQHTREVTQQPQRAFQQDYESSQQAQGVAQQPQGTTGRGQAVVALDFDFCKGCGICAKVCPVQAISME